MIGTFWSLLPPIVAIALALITKEVYSSLFIGIVIGAIFISAGSFPTFLSSIFSDGIVKQLSSSGNAGILVFLVVLGTMVALMNKAGGSAAFGRWAKAHIKSRIGAQIATICLGILIFIDDYFNCLTVGSVMRPVTDKYKVSREKLAYIIDSTAAPICIIMPISSWAAAVSGFVKGEDGLSLFIKAIPYNFYALFTILMMFLIVSLNFEYGTMKKFEENSEKKASNEDKESKKALKGTVFDLVFPIISLIVFCTLGMIYSGGFFEDGEAKGNFITAFANSDASVGLVLGSFAALILTIILYTIRKVLTFSESMACIPDGFKAMVPAILILTLAWTLKGVTDTLGAATYVKGLVEGNAGSFLNFMPALIFAIGAFLAFSTGTSWGTFGILIPIIVDVFAETDYSLMIVSISACMAGAVCGDHCSPISDTTIMASAGAQCQHVNHVSTQLPYAMTVASVSFVTYLVAGFTRNALISFVTGAALLVGVLLFIKKKVSNNK
ncbi:MAG: Na+/H+ antiporter NhaC family protein [Treponema sp.]|nr:Na+/H+ antiporter NhaC family protein [Treponema sp.]